MKNKKLKFALHELEQEMEVIRNEDLACYKAGSGGHGDDENDPFTIDEYNRMVASGTWKGGFVQGINGYASPVYVGDPFQKDSCVYNIFDYLDGNRHDKNFYYQQTLENLGYTPGSNGGVPTKDIATIGSYGGFKVTEMSPDTNGGATGVKANDGGMYVMSFQKDGIEHLVKITSIRTNPYTGVKRIYYYDPTTGEKDFREDDDYSTIYKVEVE